MRVLHVSSGNLYGGIERMLATLARHRSACPAMDPEFALCFEGRVSGELRALGAPVHLLGAVRASRPASVWRARRALRAALGRGAFDVVVCHAPWPHAVFAPVVRTSGVPLALWVHGQLTGGHWTERWARRTAPDVAVCNSRYTAGTLGAVFAGVRSAVVYPPVAPRVRGAASRADVRRELSTPDDAIVVVHVARMEELKGHRVLLHALSALRGAADWVCWLVGSAQRPREARYVEELRALARDLRITDRVRFCGRPPEVAGVYAAADVYCQPNTGPEGFGITFVEALAAGLPVVTTGIGAAPEVVDATCGVLAPPNDAAAVAAALRALVSDPPLRARLAAGAVARAALLCDPGARLAQLHATLGTVARRGARTARARALAGVPT